MLAKEELRTGNWVDTVYNIPYIKITEIKNYVVCGKNCKGISYPSLKPIPLTEEILLKCGFTVYDPKYKYFTHKDIPGILQLFDGVAEYSIDSNEVCWVNGLHQLQNLYFSLTQTELEVHL